MRHFERVDVLHVIHEVEGILVEVVEVVRPGRLPQEFSPELLSADVGRDPSIQWFP